VKEVNVKSVCEGVFWSILTVRAEVARAKVRRDKQTSRDGERVGPR
jgi:hypothetical protein